MFYERKVRLDAYCDAILGNKEHFEGKVVLDVSCGSGVLSLAAARAGAKRVYAVETTDLAETANELVSIDGSGQYVTVIQSTVEDLQLPRAFLEGIGAIGTWMPVGLGACVAIVVSATVLRRFLCCRRFE